MMARECIWVILVCFSVVFGWVGGWLADWLAGCPGGGLVSLTDWMTKIEAWCGAATPEVKHKQMKI